MTGTFGIKSTCAFVNQQKARLQRKSCGHNQTLFLSAGKRTCLAMLITGKSDIFQGIACTMPDFVKRQSALNKRKGNLFLDCQADDLGIRIIKYAGYNCAKSRMPKGRWIETADR